MKNESRYLNGILTVIAILLLILVVQRLPFGFAEKAAAISDASLGPEMQTASATLEVARANQQIAENVGKVADALESIGKAVEKSAVSRSRAE
jgi:hypothetical protein